MATVSVNYGPFAVTDKIVEQYALVICNIEGSELKQTDKLSKDLEQL